MQMNKAVAAVVRELRQKSGISQEKLADVIDSHQVYISEIENGKKIPSLPILYKIARGLGISLSDIIMRIENKIDEK